jgi:hypothetical protein
LVGIVCINFAVTVVSYNKFAVLGIPTISCIVVNIDSGIQGPTANIPNSNNIAKPSAHEKIAIITEIQTKNKTKCCANCPYSLQICCIEYLYLLIQNFINVTLFTNFLFGNN